MLWAFISVPLCWYWFLIHWTILGDRPFCSTEWNCHFCSAFCSKLQLSSLRSLWWTLMLHLQRSVNRCLLVSRCHREYLPLTWKNNSWEKKNGNKYGAWNWSSLLNYQLIWLHQISEQWKLFEEVMFWNNPHQLLNRQEEILQWKTNFLSSAKTVRSWFIKTLKSKNLFTYLKLFFRFSFELLKRSACYSNFSSPSRISNFVSFDLK